MDIEQKPDVIQFNTLLHEHNFDQLIHEPTHVKGHTLDLLIVRKPCHSISNVCVRNICISDHFIITFDI